MSHLISISCCWQFKKTIVITTNLTNPESPDNLIECSNNYSNASGSLWIYYRNESNDTLTDSELVKSKVKIRGSAGGTPNNGNTKDIKIAVPLKDLSNFWRSLEMPLIDCEINLILTWSTDCVISSATGAKKFAITDAKLYFLVVTLFKTTTIQLLI